jgi:spore coat protein CotH
LDDPKITADMGIINNSSGTNNITDSFNEYKGKIGIEIRGQSSQMFPMKSYSIELRDDNDESIDEPLFGLPEESDWVLYAPYTDKTLMRNFLAYTMSNSLRHWAAHCRFAEMILNGDYVGVYVFMEKIKRDDGRVDIKKMNEDDTSGDDVTGGYIFSIDKDADAWYSSYSPPNYPNQKIQFTYVYPKIDDIVQEQKDYIKGYVDSFENALAGNDFQDPVKGFRKFADEYSFIDYLIVNEISRNVDAYRLSSFFYKNRNSINSKIIAGPVWDYDLAFRNADYCDGSLTSGWAYDFNNVCPDEWEIPFWWERLKQDTAFQSHVRCRWNQVRQTVLSNQRIMQLIDSIAGLVNEAQQRHFTRWPILGQYVWPNPQPIPSTYAEEISTLKNWLTQRLDWLDANMPSTGACGKVSLPQLKNNIAFITANPVINFNNAIIQTKTAQKIYVRVIDLMGRIVYAATLQAHAGNNGLPNASQLNAISKGMYMVNLFTDNGDKLTVRVLR